jgi:DNA-binding NtrC family response regulator
MDKPRTVLVVDDEPEVSEALQAVIERSGLSCLVASSGPEALTMLREHHVDAIVSDHDMPGMDGVELLKLASTRYPQVGRILLTARRDAEPAVRALNLGQAYRFLSKPCRMGDLLTTLHFAFEAGDRELEKRTLTAQLRRANSMLAEVRRRAPEIIDEIEARLPPLAS